jgi:HSP20 family protein
VTVESCRVLIKSGVVLVVGEKERPEPAHGPASFHLVERDFGRFARAVRVHAAVDATKAHARLRDGELRIILPKMQDRRGREILVAIETDAAATAG